MSRRRRTALCKACRTAPVRRVKWAQHCSRCWGKLGRPQAECSSCGESFSKDTMMGRRCRPCVSQAAHDKRVAEVYSLTPGRYQELLAYQGGRCFICHRKPGAKRLAVDHDHGCCPGPVSCGRCVRGLLCRGCNRDVLGHLGDSVDALHRAIEYLTTPPATRLWPDVTNKLEGE